MNEAVHEPLKSNTTCCDEIIAPTVYMVTSSHTSDVKHEGSDNDIFYVSHKSSIPFDCTLPDISLILPPELESHTTISDIQPSLPRCLGGGECVISVDGIPLVCLQHDNSRFNS